MEPNERIAKLNEDHKAALRLIWNERLPLKSVAHQLGIKEETLDKRLLAARRHLGANTSIEAARMLFQHETHPDYAASVTGYPASTIAETPISTTMQDGRRELGHGREVRDEGVDLDRSSPRHRDRFHWPWPRWKGEANDLSSTARFVWPFVLAAAILLAGLFAVGLGQALTLIALRLER